MLNSLGQCSWTECGGSCPTNTQTLTQTLTGDGGESPCISGRRSLCCGGSSGFLTNTCGWYRNAYHDSCSPGCPSGKVQLAVDSAGANCARGFGSFCCDPPINTLSGRGDPQVKEFDVFLQNFIRYSRCDREDGASIPRRDDINSFLNPTAYDVAVKMLPLLTAYLWYSSERQYITPYKEVWNDEVSANNNAFPEWDDLAQAVYSYNPVEGDTVNYLSDILCYGKLGAEALRSDAATTAHMCATLPEAVAKRDMAVDEHVRPGLRSVLEPIIGSNKTALTKRVFVVKWELDRALDLKMPTTGNALDLAGSGTLRPEFFNWFRYQGNQIEMEGEYYYSQIHHAIPMCKCGPLTIPPFLPAVFLLGTNPGNLASFLKFNDRSRFLVVHVHFNSAGLANNHLVIDQINIRHAEAIRARDANPVPGGYRAGYPDPEGRAVFRCNVWDTGLDPWNLPDATNEQMDLINRLVQTMRRWGESQRLFDTSAPDPSTYQRDDATRNIVHDAAGNPVNQFRGARFANGNGQIAFAPDGSLYDPFTRNGGDIVRTAGFYLQSNGQPLP